jgi:hypothetical protein
MNVRLSSTLRILDKELIQALYLAARQNKEKIPDYAAKYKLYL